MIRHWQWMNLLLFRNLQQLITRWSTSCLMTLWNRNGVSFESESHRWFDTLFQKISLKTTVSRVKTSNLSKNQRKIINPGNSMVVFKTRLKNINATLGWRWQCFVGGLLHWLCTAIIGNNAFRLWTCGTEVWIYWKSCAWNKPHLGWFGRRSSNWG